MIKRLLFVYCLMISHELCSMESEEHKILPIKLRFKLINNKWNVASSESPRPTEMEKNVIYLPYEVIKKYTQDVTDPEIVQTATPESAVPPLNQSTYSSMISSKASSDQSKLRYRPYHPRRKKQTSKPACDS